METHCIKAEFHWLHTHLRQTYFLGQPEIAQANHWVTLVRMSSSRIGETDFCLLAKPRPLVDFFFSLIEIGIIRLFPQFSLFTTLHFAFLKDSRMSFPFSGYGFNGNTHEADTDQLSLSPVKYLSTFSLHCSQWWPQNLSIPETPRVCVPGHSCPPKHLCYLCD